MFIDGYLEEGKECGEFVVIVGNGGVRNLM